MSEPLTAAGAARKVVRLGKTTLLVTSADIRRGLRELGRPGTRGEADVFVAAQAVADWLDDGAPEAAARAVDEALSVERVREVLHRGGWGVPAGGCIQHSFTTARDGVTCVREDTTADTCEHASVHSTFAAALVAHLRGPRDG